MIKKLLSVVLFVSTIGIIDSFAQANCTPDISCVPVDSTFGICPDSATGIPVANLNQPYSVTMSIKVPASTTQSGQTVNLTHLAVSEVQVDTDTSSNTNYVAISTIGLDYLGSGTNTPSGGASGITSYTMTKYCYWDAPGTACVVVSGTPNTAGNFPVRIKSYGRGVIFGFPSWLPAPDNNDYVLVVNGPSSVELLNSTKFEVAQNAPNPFNEKTEIRYSSPTVSDVEFKVYNLLGAVVYNDTFKADKGMNTITLKANAFAPGAYMYSVKNDNQTITRRMVVTQ